MIIDKIDIEIITNALKAQKQMRDTIKPKKLDEALSWLENERLADNLYEQAIEKLQNIEKG